MKKFKQSIFILSFVLSLCIYIACDSGSSGSSKKDSNQNDTEINT